MPRKVQSPLKKPSTVSAGRYYVLYRLCREGIQAYLGSGRAPSVEVLDPTETVVATLEVKTTIRGIRNGWRMNDKHERFEDPRCFYALVDLKPELPVVYIVPSKVVAERLWRSHRAWLADDKRRKDSRVRQLMNDGEWLTAYRERWDLLLDPGAPSSPLRSAP